VGQRFVNLNFLVVLQIRAGDAAFQRYGHADQTGAGLRGPNAALLYQGARAGLLLALPGIALLILALLPGGYLGFLREGSRVRELRLQVAALEERRGELDAEARHMASRAGCDSPQAFEALRMEYLELLARRKEIADKLEVLVPDGEVSGLEERARRLAVEVGMLERRLKELQGRVVDPLRLQEVLREKEVLRRRLDGLREERVRCEVVLSGEEVEEELLRVEEELAELEERRARLSRRAEALRLALDWLERAATDTLSSAARRLESLAGDYLGRITGGRYGRVMVDGNTLELSVWSQEKGGPATPSSLSRGTVDQLYLAARLSLVEIICGDRNPPLLLDDPFVTFDPRRLDRAMEVLGEFSRGCQVIIFTCGDDYDAYADQTVQL
jgi:DNA repair exonuclease SbcCD ATPase subunit